MKLPLSNRLLACCGFVRKGDRVVAEIISRYGEKLDTIYNVVE